MKMTTTPSPTTCPVCHQRDAINPRAEIVECMYCLYTPPTSHTPAELAIIDESLDRADDLAAHLEDEGLLTWDKLLQVPGYVLCDVSDIHLLIITANYGLEHSLQRPFCSNECCGCHKDNILFDAYIMEPMLAGLLTSYEANRIMWPE